MGMSDNKSLTLRLPLELYRELTLRKKKSVSQFVVDAVTEKLARERQEELARGFAELAGPIDDETSEWMKAQEQAMQHVEG